MALLYGVGEALGRSWIVAWHQALLLGGGSIGPAHNEFPKKSLFTG